MEQRSTGNYSSCGSGPNNISHYDNTNGLPILIPMYCFTFILGVFPNVLLVYLISTRKVLRERYIMNASISAAHIVFCVLVLPLSILHHVTSDKPTLRVCEFFVCCIVSGTSLTMAITAARRALALSETFRYKLGEFRLRNKLMVILFTWIASTGLATPLVVDACAQMSPFSMITYQCNNLTSGSKMTPVDIGNTNNESVECANGGRRDVVLRLLYEEPCYAYSLTIAMLLIYMACPVSLILQGYGYRCIKRRPNQKLWEKELMLTKQHLLMIITFLACWTPLTIINLLKTREDRLCGLRYAFQSVAIVFVLANPILYFIFNQNMKHEFKKWRKDIISKGHTILSNECAIRAQT